MNGGIKMNEWQKQERNDLIKKFIIGFVAVIAIILILGLTTGYMQAFFNRTIGVEIESSKREIYKENKSHVEGMIKDLANYKMQYELSDDEKEKNAIKSRIINDFANFDIRKIDNEGLREYLIEMRGF
jgi:hypothetical protein